MSLLLLDLVYAPGDSGREWEKILPAFRLVRFDDRTQPAYLVDDTGDELQPLGSGHHLIVVHRSSIEESGARVRLIAGIGIPVLVVSRDIGLQQVELDRLPDRGNFYYRKAGVLTGDEEVDVLFRDLFADFWDKYQETGKLDWAMLEPKADPRSLVAVYLVAKSAQLNPKKRKAIVAGWDIMATKRKQDIWRQALQEYVGQEGTPKTWKALGLRDGEGKKLDFDDVKIDAAVTAIESVLHKSSAFKGESEQKNG